MNWIDFISTGTGAVGMGNYGMVTSLDRQRGQQPAGSSRKFEAQDMKPLHRRQFLHLAAGVVRPVAGGSNDLYARLIGQFLSERIGQQFVVENRTGAGGSIATGSVAAAPPDGYTLLLTAHSDAFNTAL
jgi:hypothetical protein